MENLIFSLNATVPIFLLMILGIFLRKIGWVDHAFASKMNTFVFRLPLPVLVFSDGRFLPSLGCTLRALLFFCNTF